MDNMRLEDTLRFVREEHKKEEEYYRLSQEQNRKIEESLELLGETKWVAYRLLMFSGGGQDELNRLDNLFRLRSRRLKYSYDPLGELGKMINYRIAPIDERLRSIK